jgi:hypothetical protein
MVAGYASALAAGPATATTDTAIVHMANTAMAIVDTDTTAIGTDPTEITTVAPIAVIGRVVQFVTDTGQAVQLVVGSDTSQTSVHRKYRATGQGRPLPCIPAASPGRLICREV